MISPKRWAMAFLERLVGLENSILGDLEEQSHRSALWLWRQALGIAGIYWFRLIFRGTNVMKRMAISMSMLLAVFLLGFWSGRTELFVQPEEPPRLSDLWAPEKLPRRQIHCIPETRVLGTTEFFRQELESAQAQDGREKTPESKQRVEHLKEKLADARRAEELEKENRRYVRC
jgi:hypothetical protein